MKLARICLAIIATLMFATICAAQCGPAKPKGGGSGSLDDMIIAQEQMILDAVKKRDANAFKSMLDPNAYEITSNGVIDLAGIVAVLFSPELTSADFKIENPTVRRLDKDSAVISYKSTGTATYKGKTSSGSSYDTTIYVRRGGKWLALFHQATDMMPAASMASEK
ncbi:MAG TPA: nuclear transport factor 2 family protein [Pyrinomonadaceae bacterium]|jgi:hypothetical protein